MKKLRAVLLITLLWMVVVMLKDTTQTVTRNDLPLQLTFISPLPWDDAAAGIQKTAPEENSYVKLVGSRIVHYEKMIESIHSAVYSDSDGIIIAGAVPSEEMTAAVNHAAAKQIPVILMDNDLEGTERISYIANDNYSAGKLAGQDIKEGTGGTAKIGIVVSDLDVQNQKERMRGFIDAIEDCPQLQLTEVIECHSDKLLVMEKVSEMLLRHPEIDALFLAEGCASDVVGELLEERQIQDLCIVAFDGNKVLDYVRQGLYYSTLKSKMYEQAVWTVRTLKKYADGESVSDHMYIDVWHATHENVEEIRREVMESMEGTGEFQWQFY